jgi:hypothetical protein
MFFLGYGFLLTSIVHRTILLTEDRRQKTEDRRQKTVF